MSDVKKNKYYFNFGIDCAPSTPRPNVYAEEVFKHLGVEPFEAQSKLFGAWKWSDIELDMSDSEVKDLKKWMKSKMDAIYNEGKIRGAEWDISKEKTFTGNDIEDLKRALNKNNVEYEESDDKIRIKIDMSDNDE